MQINGNRYEIHTETGDNRNGVIKSTIWIMEARKKKESALFKCQVYNDVGAADFTARVTIIEGSCVFVCWLTCGR